MNAIKKILMVAVVGFSATLCIQDITVDSKDSQMMLTRANACQMAVVKAASQSEKCCNRLSKKLSQVDTLAISLTDEAAECCATITNIEAIVATQVDRFATCCSQTDVALGTLDETAQIPVFPSTIDNVEYSLIKLLKTIYLALTEIQACACV